jgi:YHS domain-containing protein
MMGEDMKKLMMVLPLLLAACGKEEPQKSGMNGAAAVSNDRAKDPVCGMMVDRATDKKVTHDGATYYFCADKCVADFKADPKKYAVSCLCAKSTKKCACEHCGGATPCDCAK